MNQRQRSLPNESASLSPLHCVLIAIASVFTLETLVMFLLDDLFRTSPTTAILIAGVLLSVLLAPVLFFTCLRPMQRALSARTGAAEQSREIAMEAGQLGHWDLDLIKNQAHRSLRHDQIFGYSELLPEWSYDVFLRHVIPEDREHVAECVQTAYASSDLRMQCRIQWPDESIHWIDATGRVYRDANGKPVRMAGVVRDITEEKRIQEGIRKTEHLYRSVIAAAAAVPYARNHVNDCFSYLGERIEKLTGYSAAEMTCALWDSIIQQYRFRGELAGMAWDEAVRKVRTGEVAHWQSDILILSRDGQKRWIADTSLEIFLESGESIGSLGLLQDISERKRAEDTATQLAAIVESSQDAMISVDLDGMVQAWNRGAEQIYGYSREEVLARSAQMLVPAERSDEPALLYARARQGERINGYETVRIRKDGQLLDMSMTLFPIENSSGDVIGFGSVSRDITENKRLTDQALRNDRIESIGTLAGGIAHDLNNVLAPILMAMQIMKSKFPDEQSQRLLSTVETSARRGADLVKQVLTFSRGVKSQDQVAINLRHLLKEMKSIGQHTFPKSIWMNVSAPKDLWVIEGDPTHIHQVLMNLCVNARDAMPKGGELKLTSENFMIDEHFKRMNIEAHTGPYVLLKVSDTGTGMPPEVRNRIFEPFFTTKDQSKGTGLGLATVRGIVKSMGGFIHVYSEVGRGSEFRIYIPALQSEQTTPPAVERMNLPHGNGELILVVDDEQAIVEIAKQTLEMCGYKVLIAMNGAQAIATFVEHRDEIQLVLTDSMMPVMDGSATIVALRNLDPKVKIIGNSGLGSAIPEMNPENAGLDAFIQKPYTAELLARTVSEVLKNPRADHGEIP